MSKESQSDIAMGRALTLFFTPVALVMLFSGPAERVGAFKELVSRHASTTAHVTATECWDHHKSIYSFTTNGKAYSGDTSFPDDPCDSTLIGRAILVYFDPRDPTVNSTSRPSDAYFEHRNTLIGKSLTAFAILCVAAFALFRGLAAGNRKN